VIDVGEPVPDVRVWSTPRDTLGLRELTDEGPYLLLFYLFDWSST
jgi:peroxiredoxin